MEIKKIFLLAISNLNFLRGIKNNALTWKLKFAVNMQQSQQRLSKLARNARLEFIDKCSHVKMLFLIPLRRFILEIACEKKFCISKILFKRASLVNYFLIVYSLFYLFFLALFIYPCKLYELKNRLSFIIIKSPHTTLFNFLLK